MGLSFTIAAGPRQRSHSQVRVPRYSWTHFTLTDSRLPQPGGPGSRIYIPQEQGGPVITPGTGFSFRRGCGVGGGEFHPLTWGRKQSPETEQYQVPCYWVLRKMPQPFEDESEYGVWDPLVLLDYKSIGNECAWTHTVNSVRAINNRTHNGRKLKSSSLILVSCNALNDSRHCYRLQSNNALHWTSHLASRLA
jgi:hypothetical protein